MNCTKLFLLLVVLVLCEGVTGSFIAPPENITVYSGQMAMFTCQVTQSGQEGLYWFITEERLQPNDLEGFYQAREYIWNPEGFDDPHTSSIALEMIGISETNNTSVECLRFYPNGEYILSDRVYLRVQGILDTPSNLASSVMNNSVLITWNPPSTLPDTTISFTINASVGDHSETFTTSQHNFLIGLCDLVVSGCYSNCEVSVSVRSINQAGEGEQAFITVPLQPFSCDGTEHERLGPPIDLVGSAMDDSLSVSWSPPSSSHAISHYSMDVWDTQTESLIANGTETSDLKYTLAYRTAGIDTCNKGYNVVITVCGVNAAGKGETANTTLAIQQNLQSCPYLIVPIAATVGGLLIMITFVTVLVLACIWMKRRNKRNYGSKQSPIETGKNPSYEDAPSLKKNPSYGDALPLEKNPCYEEPPHLYESVEPIYNTVIEVTTGPHQKGVISLLYPAHENA